MSEEYTHVGTVRRRPRTGHQRSDSSARHGRPGSNGSARRDSDWDQDGNEREFEREYAHDSSSSENETRRRARSSTDERQERKELPFHESDLDEEPMFRFPFDPWRLYGAVKRNLGWILLSGVLLTLIGFFLAMFAIQYKVSVPLIRKTSNAVRSENMPLDQFMPREYSEQTLYSFMKSSEVLTRVSEKTANDPRMASLRVTPEKLAEAVNVKATPNPDFVIMTMKTFGGLQGMVDLANLYGQEMVAYTREIQRKEARAINQYLQGQIAIVDTNIMKLTAELREFSGTGFIPFDKETASDIQKLTTLREDLQRARMEKEAVEARIQALGGNSAAPATKLEQAREELKALLIHRTEKHPDVEFKKREIERLEKQPNGGGPAQAGGSAVGTNPLLLTTLDLQGQKSAYERRIEAITAQLGDIDKKLGGESGKNLEYEIKKQELASYQKTRDKLAEREGQSRMYVDNSLGYFDVLSPATLASIDYKKRWMKVSLLAMVAGLAGLFLATAMVMLSEMLDTKLRTAEDVTRATGLPVLASLGDLTRMSAQQQVKWAFRTLTLLRGKMSRNADQALVCGIISANHGEGRSTWVNLLVGAASQRGLRVLTVDTRPAAGSPEPTAPKPETPENAAGEQGKGKEGETNGHAINLPDQPTETLSKSVLSTPAKVAEQLEDPNAQPLVHIPLPGWVWNLERRKQWQKALEYWKDIDNLVIFVELPPASEQESLLLAEHLPQCLWLAGSGMADATETAAHIETLRHGRCNLVGAVLNFAPPPFLDIKISRWFSRSATALLLCASLNVGFSAEADRSQAAQAQLTPAQEETLAFSANPKRKRAKWQERLTLGPGDTVDIHFYGNSALSRTNVFIGPDGRINYLQATGLTAAGLTIEELRARLDKELSEYYPAARTMVIPASFSSKKYFMLGKVNAKGAYPLDRPLTLLEAVARAKGLETGLYQRTTVEMADLGRSFIVREGEKLPIDFEKLFLEGDLSQNVSMEPNDYVFFASTGANDIYVLGEVMNPGPLGFVQSATVLTAIADRGGYSEKAFKKRVLVVRGSLNEPETFVVDSGGALDARTRDFKLQPRDIVYVSRRPWVKAEELLDEAASSFIQGAVTTWAGVNVGPIITKRLLPRARNSK